MIQRAVDQVEHFMLHGAALATGEYLLPSSIRMIMCSWLTIESLTDDDRRRLMRELGEGVPEGELSLGDHLVWCSECAEALCEHIMENYPLLAMAEEERQRMALRLAGIDIGTFPGDI